MRPRGLDIFIYLRKSRKDEDEERRALSEGRPFDTLARHRKTLLELAQQDEHNIIQVYEEVVSGDLIIQRPEIQEMLRRVEQGEAEAVLAMDLDRLGRGDMFDMGMIYRTLLCSNTLFITPREVIDTCQPGAEMYFGVKSIFSREELKSINHRLQSGRVDKAKDGRSISKKPAYGYLRNENLRLYPDPDKAWVIKTIFEMITNGKGRQSVANELDLMKAPTPDGGDNWSPGKPWSPSTVSEIVKNEVYLGHIIWGKFKHTKRFDGSYQRKRMPRENWHIKYKAHEPLVTEDLFEAANHALKHRYRPPVVSNKDLTNPLAGILRCEICGRSMLNQPRKDRPHNYIRCTFKPCRDKQKGAVLNLIEQRVIEGLKTIVQEFEIQLDMLPKNTQKPNAELYKKTLSRYEKDLSELILQKNNQHDLLEKQIYDYDTYIERQRVISGKTTEIEAKISNLREQISHEEQRESNVVNLLPKIKTVLTSYENAPDAATKNKLLKSVLEKVTYVRKKEWMKRDQFEIRLYPKI